MITNTQGKPFSCSVVDEHGYDVALFGLGKSHGLTSDMSFQDFLEDHDLHHRLSKIATSLAPKMYGHNKFLESIAAWLDVCAPRYWWQEFAEYRIGRTTQSESTMHTLKKKPLDYGDFSTYADTMILDKILPVINRAIEHDEPLHRIKSCIPESFMQTRIIELNYKTLANIIIQRRQHKLPEWRAFCRGVSKMVEKPELLPQVPDKLERNL